MTTTATNTATPAEWSATIAAQGMLDAIETYERFTGEIFDPSHPNARPELRRIAVWSWGVRGFKYVSNEDKKMVNRLITVLLAKMAVRQAALSA